MHEYIRMQPARGRQRFWTGFAAAIYYAAPGRDELRPVDTNISMHLGAPTLVATRCDGASVYRLQVPGDLKIFPAGFSRALDVEKPTVSLLMSLSPSLMATAADSLNVNLDVTPVAPHLHVRDPHVEHIGWAVKAELESDEPLGRLYSDSLGLALAAHLLRRYVRKAPLRAAAGLSKSRLQRVTDYIQEHLSDDLTLAELAAVANASPSHFKALFKQSVGLPVHQYVVRRRVEYAIDRLLHDDLSLSDLALQAGFSNASHLARWMRRVAGVTPGVLKRSGQ